MRPPLDGSVVMVTGASSGLGREFARLLAPRVRTLVLVARRVDRLEALRDELTATRPALSVVLAPCDLVDRAATDAMLDAVARDVGAVDVLVNNAGMGDMGLFERSSWDKTRQMLAINVDALCHLTRRLLPGMVERRRGGVLNVSSGFGLQFMPGFAAYAGTKHFVTGFTESLRLEARRTGVVVSQVCPGPVATEFEEVAGNFTGQKVPGFIELDAPTCARAALAGFERDRALVVPGLAMKVVMALGAATPRWVLRLLYGPVAARLRALQDAHETR